MLLGTVSQRVANLYIDFRVRVFLGIDISLRSPIIQERLLVIGWLSEACSLERVRH